MPSLDGGRQYAELDLGVSLLPPAAAAAPGPSTALEQLNGREHAPGGAVVEVGGERVAAAGDLLQEQDPAVSRSC